MSELARYVARWGGFCTRADMLAVAPRHEIETALNEGTIVWLSRGRYALPGLDEAVAVHGLRGVLCHLSAARWHGWEVKTLPSQTHVMLPRRRHVGAAAPTVRLHRVDLPPGQIDDGIATSPERTLVDCLRTLPPDEALAVADSALRHGADPQLLDRIAISARGPGASRIRRAASAADGRAANPFESCLRSIALGVPGLDVAPQRVLRTATREWRPDLVDTRLKIVIEADSFEWHGGRAELVRDTRRYNDLAAEGWLVLRFTYEDVMFHPAEVRAVLVRATDARTQLLRRAG